jgi:mono/diheme cytochrome c family protein
VTTTVTALGLALGLGLGLGLAACAKRADERSATAAPQAVADAAPPPDAEPPPQPVPPPALPEVAGSSAAAGKKLFQVHCASCHGEDGKGKTEAAKTWAMPPTDLTHTAYLCRQTDGRPVPIPSDADVESAIDRGAHRGVKALAGLDAPARRSLMLHVKSLARDFSGDPQPLAPVFDATTDDADARARGRTLFLAAGCWRCHGPDGAGADAAAMRLAWNDQMLTKIAPLADEASYRCGSDPTAVYRVISLGMVGSDGGFVMPRYQEFAERFRRPPEGTPETWTKALEGKVDAAEIEAVRAFLAAQPDDAAVQKLRPSERRARAGRMIWDLVHYVRSL